MITSRGSLRAEGRQDTTGCSDLQWPNRLGEMRGAHLPHHNPPSPSLTLDMSTTRTQLSVLTPVSYTRLCNIVRSARALSLNVLALMNGPDHSFGPLAARGCGRDRQLKASARPANNT